MSTLVINSPQALQHLQQTIGTMDEAALKSVQIHIEGRLAFPKIKEALMRKGDTTGRKTFGGVCVFPMGQLSAINQVGMNAVHLVTQALKSKFEVLARVPEVHFKKCYNNIQLSPVQESGASHPDFYQGSWWVNTSSGENFKPKVFKKVQGVVQQVDNADSDVYQGQEVVFVISLYPIGTDPKNTQSKKGVSANLLAILIKGGGDRWGGTANVEVDANASFGGIAGSLNDFSQGNTNPFNAGSQSAPAANSNPFGSPSPAPAQEQPASSNPFGNSLV